LVGVSLEMRRLGTNRLRFGLDIPLQRRLTYQACDRRREVGLFGDSDQRYGAAVAYGKVEGARAPVYLRDYPQFPKLRELPPETLMGVDTIHEAGLADFDCA
jgi:hypothetical protein